MRDKRTFLIRSASDDVPFDLRTDRYLAYDKNDPGASVEKLVTGLRQTIDEPATDSPIFQLVPKLQPELDAARRRASGLPGRGREGRT